MLLVTQEIRPTCLCFACDQMKTELEDALMQMRAGKILLIEVMCVTGIKQHREACASDNREMADKSSAVIAAQQSWVSSNNYGGSSEMFCANFCKMAIDLNK